MDSPRGDLGSLRGQNLRDQSLRILDSMRSLANFGAMVYLRILGSLRGLGNFGAMGLPLLLPNCRVMVRLAVCVPFGAVFGGAIADVAAACGGGWWRCGGGNIDIYRGEESHGQSYLCLKKKKEEDGVGNKSKDSKTH